MKIAEVEISMNHPLRYNGLTFYQYQMTAGDLVERAGQTPSSVLQVVRNPGWLTPYIGCAMVGAGPGGSIHVSPRRLHLEKENEMKKIFQRWSPPLLMAVMALWFFGNLQTPKDKDFAFSKFGRLPVTANGRVQPMDSLARNSLLSLRQKQTLNLEPWKDWNENPKIIPATEWLANVMMNPAVADRWPVFRVDNPDLISLLKLPEKDAAKKSDGINYSWNQIQPSLEAFGKENERVQKLILPIARLTKTPSPRCNSV